MTGVNSLDTNDFEGEKFIAIISFSPSLQISPEMTSQNPDSYSGGHTLEILRKPRKRRKILSLEKNQQLPYRIFRGREIHCNYRFHTIFSYFTGNDVIKSGFLIRGSNARKPANA